VTGWPAVVTALATAVLAGSVLVLMIGLVAALRQMNTLTARLTHLMENLDRDARPTLEAVRRTVDDAGRVAVVVRDEVAAVVGTSKRLRERAERTATALEERFLELETLLDVLQEELEDTVLDVAALLRTTRRGSGLFRAAKRAFLGRR